MADSRRDDDAALDAPTGRAAGARAAVAGAAIAAVPDLVRHGRVETVRGLLIEAAGLDGVAAIGARVVVDRAPGAALQAEIVGFNGPRALLLPFGPADGVRHGARATLGAATPGVRPTDAWLGRVIDGFGEPADGGPPLPQGVVPAPFRRAPPPAHARDRLGPPMQTGVRAIDSFLTCRHGQRLGLFAGSGVGKSVLLSMLARNADADVTIIGLIGERGRELREFIEDDLGREGLARAIVVVATSDQPALLRRQAAYLTLALAEHFRDQGRATLCMIDSLTRLAMAQREIGLAVGEPPTAKGYTPTVFTELPALLERAGPGVNGAAITGLFTVLVDGDDHNEPVADAVRGILDGHVVMERAIAERGRFPAINILKSVSRAMPGACDPDFRATIVAARRAIATYSDMEDLIRLGAYRAGASADVDTAIRLSPQLEAFLGQSKEDSTSMQDSYRRLAAIMAG